MEYIRLGDSGLQVSRIVLGCMSFGEPGRGGHPWTLPPDEARPFIVAALEAGITTFDTANVYSAGSSEEILGKVLGEAARREDVVIATKVHGRMGPGPNGGGLSRGAIATQVEASLRRLRTDHIDLYQIHRYDPQTPIEETMQALDDLVRAGKVRYLGASSMWAWQFAQAQHVAELNGWTPFVSMQDQYNLLMREEEREMLPFCLDTGVGVLPNSSVRLRSVVACQSLVSRPRASGLHGSTPTPVSRQNGSISRSSSRISRLYWSCIDTNGVQPLSSATCCACANCQAHIEDAPR